MTKERQPIFEVQCWKMCWVIPSKALLLTKKSIFPLSTILQTLQAIKTFTARISLLKLFLCLELLTLELKKNKNTDVAKISVETATKKVQL